MTNVRISIEEYIAEHRTEIDFYLLNAHGVTPNSDEDRRLWVLNDEYLYTMMRDANVDEEL